MMLAITSTLYVILRRVQDYRYNRTELSIALGSWALAYTPKPPVRRCGTGAIGLGILFMNLIDMALKEGVYLL